ncbi:MAG: ABC transporter substrate-binding protein [Acidobacteriota bacterium]|jgi:iron complex transport system substrate-binding protein
MIARRQLLALILAAAAACGRPAPSEPAAPTEARVISLVPAATEMLFAIGAGADMVAVSSFDRYPPEVERLPRVGALIDPDFERILSLRPTLVVVYASQDELIARLGAASVPVYQYVHAAEGALAHIPRTMRELGQLLGREAAAEEAAGAIEGAIERIRQQVAGRERVRTAVVFGREAGALRGIWVAGGVGFLHEALEAAGGGNVFADIRREGLQASTELMLARAPDVIIEIRTSGGVDASPLEAWGRLAAIPATRTGRIYELTDPLFSIPGPRIVEIVRTFARVLHGDEVVAAAGP